MSELQPDWVYVYEKPEQAAKASELLKDEGISSIIRPGNNKTTLLLLRVPGYVQGSRQFECARRVSACNLSARIPNVDKFPVPSSHSFKPELVDYLVSDSQRRVIAKEFGDDVDSIFLLSNVILKEMMIPALVGLVTSLIFSNSYQVKLTYMWSMIPSVVRVYYVWHKAYYEHVRSPVVLTKRAEYKSGDKTRPTIRTIYIVTVIALLALYLVGFILLLALDIFCSDIYQGPLAGIVKLIPVGGNTVLCAIYGIVYNLVISKFVDLEDYEWEEEQTLAVSKRKFTIQAFIGFSQIFLSIYFYKPMADFLVAHIPFVASYAPVNLFINKAPTVTLTTVRLMGQAKYFSVRQPLIGILTGLGIPTGWYFYTSAKSNEDKFVKEQTKPVLNVQDQLQSLVLILGYAIILSPVWPLACPISLLFIWARTKALLYNLNNYTRRPTDLGSDDSLRYLKAVIPVAVFLSYSLVSMDGDLKSNAKTVATHAFYLAAAVTGALMVIDKISVTPVVKSKLVEYNDEAQDKLWL